MSRRPGVVAAGPAGATAAGQGVTAAGPADPGPAAAARGKTAGPGRSGDPWKAAFFGLITLAIIAGVAWALLGSSLLVVRSVQTTGTPLVSRARILAAARIKLGTPLIRIDTAQVARRVEQITQVQSARVSRDWPDKIVISVLDRTPALAVAQDGRFALVDKFGVIVRWTASRPRRMALLRTDPGQTAAALRGNRAVRAAVTVLQQLPASLRRRVETVRAPTAEAVTLDLRGRITILWGGTGRSAAKAREVIALMRTHASRYDVSDPGTAVTGR